MIRESAVDIDLYTPGDRVACLRVFDSNGPRFVTPEERAGFAAFLDALPRPFWVARLQATGAVTGCDGVSITDEGRTAWLRCGMVAAEHHGRRIGRLLIAARLRWIGTQPAVEAIRVATTGEASGFFRRRGFDLVGVIENHYGPGMDRHDLMLRETSRQSEHVSETKDF